MELIHLTRTTTGFVPARDKPPKVLCLHYSLVSDRSIVIDSKRSMSSPTSRRHRGKVSNIGF